MNFELLEERFMNTIRYFNNNERFMNTIRYFNNNERFMNTIGYFNNNERHKRNWKCQKYFEKELKNIFNAYEMSNKKVVM